MGRRCVPALLDRLDSLGLDQSCYLPQAWHTLFAKWLPSELAAMAVDDLLEHGMPAVLGITLAIFAEIEMEVLAITQCNPDISALIGPEGYFTHMRAHLQHLLTGDKDRLLQLRWRELLLIMPSAQQLLPQQAASPRHMNSSPSLTGSVADNVRLEAVLCLAISASQRDDDKLQRAVSNISWSRDMATRDELRGDHQYVIKIIVVGDRGVGKSCMIHRFAHDASTNITSCRGDRDTPTVGVDFVSRTISVEGTLVKLQIWDIAGGDSFISVSRPYFRDAAAALLVYDVTCLASFEHISWWLSEVCVDRPLEVILVGNKVDLAEKRREVSFEVGERFAVQHQLRFLECSVQRADSIEGAFRSAALTVHDCVDKAGGKSVRGVTPRSCSPNRPATTTRDGDCWRHGRLAGNCCRLCSVQ